MTLPKINIFWFRRDLRLEDNTGLFHALKAGLPVIPIFIFDPNILNKLKNSEDARVSFIYRILFKINEQLKKQGACLLTKTGVPEDVFRGLINTFHIHTVFCNHDYEPYALKRDRNILQLCKSHGIAFRSYRDHVILEKDEILNGTGQPYKVFTPYKRIWLSKIKRTLLQPVKSEDMVENFHKSTFNFPQIRDIGFREYTGIIPEPILDIDHIKKYGIDRDFPARNGTTRLGIHLRHGTISIRKVLDIAQTYSDALLNELIWREFYSMILYHFPHVTERSFKPSYERIQWINNEEHYERWKNGLTGYPIVDAGMRELNTTGYMHNRIRMITASFLTKHLLIDWRWGEAYFAEKLLDFELASNNGGWQWAAGTGTDAQPYFRIFNPSKQALKYDPDQEYIRKWIPEFEKTDYPKPIIEHKFAVNRAINTYKKALNM